MRLIVPWDGGSRRAGASGALASWRSLLGDDVAEELPRDDVSVVLKLSQEDLVFRLDHLVQR